MKKEICSGVFSIGDGGAVVLGGKGGHTVVKVKKGMGDYGKVCSWGSDNLYPQNFYKKFVRTDAAVGGVDVLTSAHYGRGFRLYKDEEVDGVFRSRECAVGSFPAIADFFGRVRWNLFMSDLIFDYELFGVCFPEYLLSPDFSRVVSIKRHPTAHCRLGLPNRRGFVDYVYINTDWEEYDESYTRRVRLISGDASVDEVKDFCRSKRIDRFIIPVVAPIAVEKNYPIIKWHSSFRNGWVDVVNSVPEFKRCMFENQLNIKYVVYVADDFLAHKYGREQWDSYDDVERRRLSEDLIDAIDDHMSGNDSSGRSFISPYFRDPQGNLIKGIEVVPIDDKIKDGNFLPDAASGNSEILFAMGVDPCLLGAGIPGGKSLSGSGSDKREAYTILCTRMPIRRIRTLEVFSRIRDWNGWDRGLYGNFPNIVLTTLDKGKSGQQEVVT